MTMNQVGMTCALALALAACGDDGAGSAPAGGGGGGPAGGGGASTTASVVASTGTGETGGGEPAGGGGGDDGCDRGTIEPEFAAQGDGAWQGPGADPDTGELLFDDGELVASTTYLALDEDALPHFGELMGPIMEELLANPELVAVRLGISSSCGTARTLSLWRSVDGMMAFVASNAHAAAVDAVGEISRGGSVVTHWDGATTDTLDWEEAARRIEADEGPFY